MTIRKGLPNGNPFSIIIAQMTIKEAQKLVDEWIMSTGKGYFQPVTNVAALAEEVGELAHVVLRRCGEQRPKPGDAFDDEAVASELADVLWVTLALANQLGVDLSKALRDGHEKRSRRDVHRFDV